MENLEMANSKKLLKMADSLGTEPQIAGFGWRLG